MGERANKSAQAVSRSAADLLASKARARTSYKGRLEAQNIHGSPLTFAIWPPGGQRLSCLISEEHEDELTAAMGKTVTVTGLAHFRRDEFHPYKMEVHSIDVHEDDSELPSLADLLGAEPRLTGDMSSDDFISDLRDDWKH